MENSNTNEIKKKMERVQAEEFLGRFRSKEDLYRYMVHQGKHRFNREYQISSRGLLAIHVWNQDGISQRDHLREEDDSQTE